MKQALTFSFITLLFLILCASAFGFYYMETGYEGQYVEPEQDEETYTSPEPVEDSCDYDEETNETYCVSASIAEDLIAYKEMIPKQPPQWMKAGSWFGTLFSSTGGIALGFNKWRKALVTPKVKFTRLK